ncbi:hypothetical protein [Pseudomonas saponiphila]|uniref:hypothetical protein n=1 Tax=Pseudomonas saponiphila TaxID=556534 RepID=UPI000B8A05C2|nr:hypothetical protein [Pseudomonas saponiphila]
MKNSLDAFVAEVQADIEGFAAEYRRQHALNPEQYPLELSDDNSGLWIEFFVDYMTRDTGAQG